MRIALLFILLILGTFIGGLAVQEYEFASNQVGEWQTSEEFWQQKIQELQISMPIRPLEATTSSVKEVTQSALVKRQNNPTKDQIIAYLRDEADKYRQTQEFVLRIVGGESNFDLKAIGDNGCSVGLWQINLCIHKDVTRQCAEDIYCSSQWAFRKMQEGRHDIWTCAWAKCNF